MAEIRDYLKSNSSTLGDGPASGAAVIRESEIPYLFVLLLLLLLALGAQKLFFIDPGSDAGSGIGGTGKAGNEFGGSGLGGTGKSGGGLKLGAADDDESADSGPASLEIVPQYEEALAGTAMSVELKALLPRVEVSTLRLTPEPLPALAVLRQQALVSRFDLAEFTVHLSKAETVSRELMQQIKAELDVLPSREQFAPPALQQNPLIAEAVSELDLPGFDTEGVGTTAVTIGQERNRLSLPVRPERPERPGNLSPRIMPVERVNLPPPPVRPMRI
jgi:hypothetical protein